MPLYCPDDLVRDLCRLPSTLRRQAPSSSLLRLATGALAQLRRLVLCLSARDLSALRDSLLRLSTKDHSAFERSTMAHFACRVSPTRIAVPLLALFLSGPLFLSGCSSRIATNQANMAKLEQKNELMVGGAGNRHVAAENQVGIDHTQQDMAVLQTVSEGLLHAWRTACADKDDKAAMLELKEMQKQYPQILQVEFMMGQVEDHFGKREAAIAHFRKAASGNEFSSMHQFKLADVLRRSGKYKEAESYFRKLYNGAPDIVPYQYMLGDCLCGQDKNSKEGRQLIESALKAAPNDDIAKGIAKARL